MQDGTYLNTPSGPVNYAARWSFGYVVGVRSIEPTENNSVRLYGYWTDVETGVLYADEVEHISSRDYAIEVARSRGELAIYDLFSSEVVYV